MLYHFMRIAKSMTFEEYTWKRIDEAKGDVSRSRFLEKLIVRNLEVPDQSKSAN